MRVRDILTNKGDTVVTISSDATVNHALILLTSHRIGALVVSPDGRLVTGIVSERDIVTSLARHGHTILDGPVSQISTPLRAWTRRDATIENVMDTMTVHRVRHLPVLDEHDHLDGLVSIGDAVNAAVDTLRSERDHLMSYVTS